MRQDYFFVPAPKGELSSDREPISVNCAGLIHNDAEKAFVSVLPAGREDYSCFYLFGGRLIFSIDGGEEVPVEGGHLILIPPRVPYRFRMPEDGEMRIYWVHFTGNGIPSFLSANGIPPEGGIFPEPVSAAAIGDFQTMLEEMKEFPDACVRLRTAALFLAALSTLTKLRRAGDCPRFSASVRYLHEHFAEPVSKEYLAGLEGLHLSRFNDQFRRVTGYSPSEYQTALRMRFAERLLTDPNVSVRTVSERCGYTDPYYFSRAFRREHGISPREYRVQMPTVKKNSPATETAQPTD